jgi:cytochrome c oxidase cbb3-type subunit 3
MRLFVVLAAWAALLPGLALAAAPLRVCLLTHEGALADKAKGVGFDVDVGRAVAEQMGRAFVPIWIENQAKMTDVDDSDLPLMPLAKGKCDAVPSVPGPEALDDDLKPYVTLSRPYYGAGFEMVGPKGTSADLNDLHGKKVSVQSVTVAHLVAVALGLDWSAQPTPAEQIAALDNHAVDAAIVWGPALGEFKRAPVAGYTPPTILRWNESFATRTSDAETTKAVDAALAVLMDNGKIAALQKANGIPPRTPFAKTFDPGALRMLQLEGAAARVQMVSDKVEAKPAATGADTAKKAAEPAPAAATEAAEDASPAVKYEKDPAAVHRGKLIYTGTCGAYCHPASPAAATDAPYLFDCDWKDGGTDEQIHHTITHGVKGTRMVSFAGALSDEDIWKVIAFLRADSKCTTQKAK